MLLIKNGIINDAINEQEYVSDILIDKGKIIKIQKGIKELSEYDIVDASKKYIYPGFVEAHSHIGLDGFAIVYVGQDYNEYHDIITPQLRAIDGINPMDKAFQLAAEAGITSVSTGPGSSNVLGGTFTAIKTVGTRVDDMVIKESVAMKCAFGENPKVAYQNDAITSRMTIAAKLRETLYRAEEYKFKKELAGNDKSKWPPFDIKLEALIPVLNREIPLKAHAHQANDIFTAIRIAKEFNLKLTLEHVAEGPLIVNELVKENIPLAIGPSLIFPNKFEIHNLSIKTPGILANAGCQVSIITDSAVIPQWYLPLCAALAVKDGMKEFAALKAITINPAKHIGIEDRVGSIEVGKDADIIITNGNPFEIGTKIEQVFINGVRVEKVA